MRQTNTSASPRVRRLVRGFALCAAALAPLLATRAATAQKGDSTLPELPNANEKPASSSSIAPLPSTKPTTPPAAPSVSSSASTAVVVPEKPHPRATIGTPSLVRGEALPKGWERAFEKVNGAVQACYVSSIESDGDQSPTMSVRVRIVPPGTVATAVVNHSNEASSTLRGCVRDAFAGVVVVSEGLASPRDVLVPIAFSREADDDATRPTSACAETCTATLDDDEAEVLRARAQSAAYCFRRAAAAGEEKLLHGGTLELSLRIAGDGSICGTSTMSDSFDRPSLTACVLEVMSAPIAIKPTGCADVTVPFSFKGR